MKSKRKHDNTGKVEAISKRNDKETDDVNHKTFLFLK